MTDDEVLRGEILNAPVDIDQTTITVTSVEALQMALNDCHYSPADKISDLRRRLIRVKHILRQVIEWMAEDDDSEPEPNSLEARLDAIFDNQNKLGGE